MFLCPLACLLQPPKPRGRTLAALSSRPTSNLDLSAQMLHLPTRCRGPTHSPAILLCTCPLGTTQLVAQQSVISLGMEPRLGLEQGDVRVVGDTVGSCSRRFLSAPSQLRPPSSQISVSACPVLLESSRAESGLWSDPLASGPARCWGHRIQVLENSPLP